MKFRETLFWDVDPKTIDTKKHAQYIIERVADFGNDKEARWLLNFYRRDHVLRVVTKSRCLRPETKRLWQLMLKK